MSNPEEDLPPHSPSDSTEHADVPAETAAESRSPIEEAFREEAEREQSSPSISPLSYVAPLPELDLPQEHFNQDLLAEDQPIFQSWDAPDFAPPVRIPHMGHVVVLAIFAFFGLMGATLGIRSGIKAHLYGVTTMGQAITDIHFTLGSEVILYFVTFILCLIFFPMIWQKPFFAGLQWNGRTALELRQRLFITAAICFALALINGVLLPGPEDAPIDKIFPRSRRGVAPLRLWSRRRALL